MARQLPRLRRAMCGGALSLVLALTLGMSAAVAQDEESVVEGCWDEDVSLEAGYPQWESPPNMVIDEDATYIVTLETSMDDIVVELNSEAAPIAVNSFVCLADDGYYDFTLFHRVINGFMLQGGDPTGTGTGSPGYELEDELPEEEGVYTRGILAMANAGPDTSGSQFFIIHQDYDLDPDYTIFGEVIEGIEVVDAIADIPVRESPAGEQSAPVRTVGIHTATVEQAD